MFAQFYFYLQNLYQIMRNILLILGSVIQKTPLLP